MKRDGQPDGTMIDRKNGEEVSQWTMNMMSVTQTDDGKPEDIVIDGRATFRSQRVMART